MIKVFFATRFRGAFLHLFQSQYLRFSFFYKAAGKFEADKYTNKLLSHIFHRKLIDHLGIIRSIRCREECDIYGSMNHFLSVNKPYFISVENPTALYHYCLGRKNTLLGRRRLYKLINKPQLRALIFWSKACANTFEQVCAPISKHCIAKVIYPLIPQNKYVTEESLKRKSQNYTLKMLFIAQGRRFASKGALETIESFIALRNKGYHIHLTMITSLHEVSPSILKKIQKTEGVTLFDFQFSYSELEKMYAENNIFIQPTSDDSFGFTILEAMKGGNAIIATSLYAIPELVKENVNGFLTSPHFDYFDKGNVPNPAIWCHTKKTIYSKEYTPSARITDFITNKIELLYKDRTLLNTMCINSWNIANNSPFDERTIANQWNEVIETIY